MGALDLGALNCSAVEQVVSMGTFMTAKPCGLRVLNLGGPNLGGPSIGGPNLGGPRLGCPRFGGPRLGGPGCEGP